MKRPTYTPDTIAETSNHLFLSAGVERVLIHNQDANPIETRPIILNPAVEG